MSSYLNAKCPYCGQTVDQTAHSFSTFCKEHLQMYSEDIRSGFAQNRLKAMQEDPESYWTKNKHIHYEHYQEKGGLQK